jgi:hypothetical protein
MDRLRAATARRAGDERCFTKALKRQHVDHLSVDAISAPRPAGWRAP